MQLRATAPPFGLSPALPAFERATWLAKALFGAFESIIVLVGEDGRAWRSRDPGGLPPDDPVAELIVRVGEPYWISDATQDPMVRDSVVVTGPLAIRFYACAPVRMADGTIRGLLCVVGREPRPYDARLAKALAKLADGVADECDRAQAREAAARSAADLDAARHVLSAFVETVPVALFMTDQEMRVIRASPKWLERLELGPEQVIGRCLYDIDPEYFPRFRSVYDRVLAGETVSGDRVRSLYRGNLRWLKTEIVPWRDATGAIGGVIAAAYDVSELVEAIEHTERSEQRLKLAAEIADLYVWEMDYQRRELFTTGGADTFFDQTWSYQELEKDTNVTIDPRDRERIAEEWRAAVRADEPYFPEYRINRLDGKEVWAACSVRLVRGEDGRPQRMVGAMLNVTERKKAEQALIQAKEDAEAANRAKSTFLATMSHEIRTPLNGVLGMAQAMAADELSSEQRERLEVVRQSGETLLAILNDVLDLSKIEAGKLELEETEFDIAELARGAHAAFSAIAAGKGVTFDLTVAPEAQGVWLGDSTRVRQILYNLVSNALKFTEQGEVRVLAERKGGALKLTVRDTGIGISRARMVGLFQKFEQADASTTRRYGGTGLGLAICRELAQLMGGSVTVRSAPGKGSTFVVSLPLPKVAITTGRDGAPSAPVPAPGRLPAKARVLAAEDNKVNQLVLRTLLQQIGVEPEIVEDGAQAVAAWEEGAWDVVLMDVQMPGMDGPAATREIRRRERASGRARTPIIALTANAMSHQVAEYLEAGMDAFVPKPIEAAKLYDAVEQALQAAGPARLARSA